jgi:hypothetical protein
MEYIWIPLAASQAFSSTMVYLCVGIIHETTIIAKPLLDRSKGHVIFIVYISIDCQLMVCDSAWFNMSLASAIEFMCLHTRHITTHRPMAYPSWSNQISTLKYLPTSFPFHPFQPNSIVSLYFPSSYQWHDSLEIGCIRALQGYRTCRDEVRGWVNRNCSRNLQFSKWYRRRGWRSIIYHPARIFIW